MVVRSAGPAGPSIPIRRDDKLAPGQARGWRPSRERGRLGVVVWIAGVILVAGLFGAMAALFGAG